MEVITNKASRRDWVGVTMLTHSSYQGHVGVLYSGI